MDKPKKGRWDRLKHWLTTAYRLVILNDETFGERFSIKTSPLGLIIFISAVTIVMTTLLISVVAFTPLREYIPGYGNYTDRKNLLSLYNRVDSVESALQSKQAYLDNLLNVMNEKIDSTPKKPRKDTLVNYKAIENKPSDADLELRKEVEEMKGSQVSAVYQSKSKLLDELVFYSPVKGIVTTSFNSKEDHLGVDVVTKPDESIKAPLDGTVIYTGFTVEDGYIIQIQHANNLTSIYKHTSKLLRQTGDRIKTADVIGLVGNTGTNSKGPHLHFELWYNGAPVNPEEFLSF